MMVDSPNNYSCNTLSTDLEDFSSLNLSDISPKKKVGKKPRKVLHFSDGTLEEYSTDEEEEEEKRSLHKAEEMVDPKTLSWGPWMNYWAGRTGKSIITTCDNVGGNIAYFLGITSPKYFYEIEEYKRAKKEEEEEKKEVAEQMAGWSTGPTMLDDDITSPKEHFQSREFIKKDFEFESMKSQDNEKY